MLINTLKKGDIFYSNLNSVKKLDIIEEESPELYEVKLGDSYIKKDTRFFEDRETTTIYYRSLNKESNECIQKSGNGPEYLIFRYLGNNLCEEYYSKKVMRVSAICHHNKKRLVHEYHELKKYPLSVSYRDISKINTNEKKRIVFEGIYEDRNDIENIVKALDIAEKSSIEFLDYTAKRMAEEVYAEAYGANELYNFKKRLK